MRREKGELLKLVKKGRLEVEA
ncbi:hypothetical protein LCGC14_0552030, partial [marine sediment metagenome]